MARRRFSREQWGEWIGEQAASGLSVAEFCRQREISAQSFYLWRRKLAGSQAATGQFVPLLVIPASELIIDLPCGATIRVPVEQAILQRVLSVLWPLERPQS
jgi:transposase-like protein